MVEFLKFKVSFFTQPHPTNHTVFVLSLSSPPAPEPLAFHSDHPPCAATFGSISIPQHWKAFVPGCV